MSVKICAQRQLLYVRNIDTWRERERERKKERVSIICTRISVRFSTTAKKALPRIADFICGNKKRTANPHKCTLSCGIGRETKVSIRYIYRVWTHLFSTAQIAYRYNPAGPPGNLGRATQWNARYSPLSALEWSRRRGLIHIHKLLPRRPTRAS